MRTPPPKASEEPADASNGAIVPLVDVDAGASVRGGVDRLSEPLGLEEALPRLPFTVVGVGASAGGLEAYTEFLQGCKPDAGIAYVLIQHLSPKYNSMMAELLQKHTAMPVAQIEDAMQVRPDHVYMIRPGFTVTIRDGRLHLGEAASESMHRRPVDDFFKSLAEEQRERSIAVILSGTGSNGTLGCESIKTVGGFSIAQDPESAKFPSMPRSLIDSNLADAILQPAEMFATIEKISSHPYAAGRENAPDVTAKRERLALGEIIAILRARTRHDFSVYKKPTLIRRIQRRMSLMQLDGMSDYARVLRQTPSEVTSLSDDLMIHVTGFFRDPEVWNSLRDRVIRPLISAKEADSPLRCWVTACSSGEEAYTIGMLLLEAAEAAGKHFDIKIFATDTAERSLSQARAGVFPGGIESEIEPERLARFFDKDEAFYRVKRELRELVVFAPQNVFQDPPFSRLDLCTCRNLLIYIEPETQQRILAMLHFGLRDGGTLLLGNSETIAGAEDLFEPIDKQHRIYRRVGPTQHGRMEFPVPEMKLSKRAALQLGGEGGGEQPRALTRATVAQLATRALLDSHTPAAVVIDRAGQIVHVHGDTDRFLKLPPGEPTRDLLLMAREEVRGGLRSVLQRAMSSGEAVHHLDGRVGEGADRLRIELTAEPLGGHAGQLYFLVSFATRPDAQPIAAEQVSAHQADELALELRRVREELQSTIEELQTSNEEMKASHEEVTSINEELQSSNEELETSKEELQSLNEELSTVNAQLQAKMDELERTSNDLGSLLTSTDIAVVFLDRGFRIRRYTPATKKLMELIPSDIGRPVEDLAWRFEDAALADDARRVLETLVPAEATVTANDGRIYDRRVLPFRTVNDRIEGVVVTFVDITERRRAEETVLASQERQAFLLRLIDVLRPLADPVAIELNAARLLGEQLGVDRAFYGEVEADEDHIVIHRDFAAAGMASFAGRFRISDVGCDWLDAYRAGRTLVTSNVSEINGLHPASFEAAGFRACVGVPMSKNGRLVGILVVHSAAPREWTESEITLIEATAERTWAAVDRAKAQQALQASEARYRSLFDSMDEGYCILEMIDDASGAFADLRFLEVNPAFEKNNGLADAAGRTLRELAPEIESKWLDIFGGVARTGKPVRLEEHSAALGRWFDLYAVRVDLPERQRVAVLFTDITQRKSQEIALRESELQYRLLAANLPSGAAFVVDRDLRYRLAEGEALKAAGFTSADFEGKTIFEALPPHLASEFAPFYRRALGGGSFRQEHFAHGRWFVTHGAPLRAEGADEITGVLAVSYDITDRKLAEQRAGEGEQRFGLVVQNLFDYAIFMLDPTGLIVGWWEGAERVTGYGHEAIGHHFRLFYPPELATEPDRELQTAAETGRSEVEGWRIHKSGSRYWVNEIVTALRNEAGDLVGFAKIARDLTEQKRSEEELKTAKVAAESASHVKDDFLATLSHELRTPLSAILIWTKLLQMRTPHDEQNSEGLAAIQSSAEAQKQLIDDMLDSSRIASGQLRLELIPVDLREVVESAVETIRPTAEAKGLTLLVDLAQNLDGAMGDPDRLRQIVWNLLTNAVKFTPDEGQIRVTLAKNNGRAELRVADNGRGIAAEFVPQIFQRFLQEDTGTTRRSGGLGLGLSIVRQLVEMHNGTIEAMSDGLRKGATFVVTLPMRAGKHGKPRTTNSSEASIKMSPSREIDLQGVSVLLVEDDPYSRRATAQLLTSAGAVVDVADSAASAMTALQARLPDVLLSDIGMPAEDGVSLVKRFRASAIAGAAELPAIALTAFAQERDAARALEAGFDKVIVKPFEALALLSAIREAAE